MTLIPLTVVLAVTSRVVDVAEDAAVADISVLCDGGEALFDAFVADLVTGNLLLVSDGVVLIVTVAVGLVDSHRVVSFSVNVLICFVVVSCVVVFVRRVVDKEVVTRTVKGQHTSMQLPYAKEAISATIFSTYKYKNK